MRINGVLHVLDRTLDAHGVFWVKSSPSDFLFECFGAKAANISVATRFDGCF
ncbi:hypothetical protein BSU04_27365 [Caballeronia sordidicola]|uniref:Uncharacterized protein n=1 Tax=Caballeronia sordidicola TaxID=196367 RepID=A0A226WWX4_CABSO|nr:hypothetical protein BSU04_27365 [Caballeronia sordidicola]